MISNRVALLSALLSALWIFGCRTTTVYNPRVTFTPRDESQVGDAILKAMEHQALARRPWISRKEKPGLITGILNVRAHQARVRIEYDQRSYSIQLVDSHELLYERKSNGEEVIHKNYNVWIKLLVNDINAYLGIFGVADEQPAQDEPGK